MLIVLLILIPSLILIITPSVLKLINVIKEYKKEIKKIETTVVKKEEIIIKKNVNTKDKLFIKMKQAENDNPLEINVSKIAEEGK